MINNYTDVHVVSNFCYVRRKLFLISDINMLFILLFLISDINMLFAKGVEELLRGIFGESLPRVCDAIQL